MQRKAFTLVELLVVIAILALLASMMLFALAGAEGTAKEMRTKATIAKLDAIISQKWESYKTLRIPAKSFQQEPYVDVNGNGVYDGGDTFNPLYHDLNENGVHDTYRRAGVAMFSQSARRELMRLDMPDRMTDLQDDPVTPNVIGHPTDRMSAPSSWNSYRRSIPAGLTNDKYQGAECLYLIVTKGSGDPDIMEQFTPSEMGDKDEDGLMEFWDAWDNPISFLRWAPGFNSVIQRTVAPIEEHDPFDQTWAHRPTNTSDPWYVAPSAAGQPPQGKHPPIFPLIYSAGPDGEYGIVTDSMSPIRYAVPAAGNPPNNPYYFDGTPRVGSLDGDGSAAIDNITNHD